MRHPQSAHPLQNAPGRTDRREFPVRATVRNLVLDSRSSSPGALGTAVGSFLLLGVLVLVFLMTMDVGPVTALRDLDGDLGRLLAETSSDLMLLWGVFLAAGLGCFVIALSLAVPAVRRPLTEQRRYYRLRGLSAPSERQRRALRTGAHWMHYRGAWPLTLELFPTSDGMTPRQAHSFRTLRPEPSESERDGLAADWGILNAVEARAAIEHALTTGIHSAGFAVELHEADVAWADRIAALANVPTTTVWELGRAREGHPPQLLWGWDLVRTSVIIRFAVIAGYLTAEEGIDRLEQTTDFIAALFPTEEELIENCLIGFALWAGAEKRGELRARAADAAEYLRGSWPAALGPWPAPSGRPLPEAMEDGFASAIAEHGSRTGPDGDPAGGFNS